MNNLIEKLTKSEVLTSVLRDTWKSILTHPEFTKIVEESFKDEMKRLAENFGNDADPREADPAYPPPKKRRRIASPVPPAMFYATATSQSAIVEEPEITTYEEPASILKTGRTQRGRPKKVSMDMPPPQEVAEVQPAPTMVAQKPPMNVSTLKGRRERGKLAQSKVANKQADVPTPDMIALAAQKYPIDVPLRGKGKRVRASIASSNMATERVNVPTPDMIALVAQKYPIDVPLRGKGKRGRASIASSKMAKEHVNVPTQEMIALAERLQKKKESLAEAKKKKK